METSTKPTWDIPVERWSELPAEAQAALVRSDLYRALGWAFLYPDHATTDGVCRTIASIVGRAADLPTHSATIAAVEGLQRLNASTSQCLNDDFDRIFGHTISAECPPYETQYGAGIIFAQAQQLGDIAAFYRAFGVEVSHDARERPDHIAAELEFMSVLAFREAAAIIEADAEHLAQVREAERKFLVEHLAAWATSFAERLARKARVAVEPDGGFYAALAAALDATLRDELRLIGADSASIVPIEPAHVDFEPEGCSFACGTVGEPVLADLPGFQV